MTFLKTSDGVPISASHAPGQGDLAIVVAHGFSGSWRRPGVRRAVEVFGGYGGVITFDFRGHGSSGGQSTVGDREIHDLEAAVAWARRLGYARVATVGFSMGASVAIRHAALLRPDGATDGHPLAAVVAVSGPARWYYRGTTAMRRLHWVVERRLGRVIGRVVLGTRIAATGWDPLPLAPHQAAPLIAPAPFLIVHGDADPYFPVEHAHQLYEAAAEPKELWLEPGFGHAENAADTALLDRIGKWIATR